MSTPNLICTISFRTIRAQKKIILILTPINHFAFEKDLCLFFFRGKIPLFLLDGMARFYLSVRDAGTRKKRENQTHGKLGSGRVLLAGLYVLV
jgi:hypothetical protein